MGVRLCDTVLPKERLVMALEEGDLYREALKVVPLADTVALMLAREAESSGEADGLLLAVKLNVLHRLPLGAPVAEVHCEVLCEAVMDTVRVREGVKKVLDVPEGEDVPERESAGGVTVGCAGHCRMRSSPMREEQRGTHNSSSRARMFFFTGEKTPSLA
jgi:hypothetical protein